MMAMIVARTGRELQRYENNLRLVSGCIPYRLAHDEDQCINMENRIEVLMISSPNRDDMVFPKGGWENDETVEEAACREALEEAGVRGNLKENLLGVWEFRSKSRQEACIDEGGCKAYMFALEVTEELDAWPEQNNRDRKWVVVADAFGLCRYEWMRSALEEFVRVIKEEEKDKSKHELAAEEHQEQEQEQEDEEEEEEVLEVAEPSPPQELLVEDDDDDCQDCQLMSSNCHVKPANGPMGTSFGIMLPAGIFL